MSERTEARHDQLRARLTDIAEAWIAEDGMDRIKARPLAAEAGCAVGAIYTVFPDLTALVMAVNARTFHRLGDMVSRAVGAAPGASPQDRLVIMAQAYMRFAGENTRAWRSLFELDMSTETPVPDWYLEELGALFALIAAPLSELHPGADRARLDLITRTLFSSVHGITLLGLERRISALPMSAMDSMAELVVRSVATASAEIF